MEFIKKSSANDLTLTIKGIINSTNRELLLRDCAPMIERGALILDETYTPQDQVIAALSKFEVVSQFDKTCHSRESGNPVSSMCYGSPPTRGRQKLRHYQV
jgi:hypothetical protein